MENDEWLEIYNVEMELLEFSVCNVSSSGNSIWTLHNARFLYGNDYHFRLEICSTKKEVKKSENGVNEWMQEVCEKERKMCAIQLYLIFVVIFSRKKTDFSFFTWIFVILFLFCYSFFYSFIILFHSIAFTMHTHTHTHIIHPSASYIVNKMFSIGNFFYAATRMY